jgi:hypothetical protein
LAATFGAVATMALALLVGVSNRDAFWLSAGVTALCAAYPSVSLGMKLFVSANTVTRDEHGEMSVELQWMRESAAGAFLDVLVATTLAVVTILLGGLEVNAVGVLLALIGLSALDAGVRYLVIRHRALR